MSKKEISKLTNTCIELISQLGIELTWSEKVAMRYYVRCFQDLEDKGFLKSHVHSDALHLFLIDYFGLDDIELGHTITLPYGENDLIAKKYGLGFIERIFYLPDPRFKEYCKKNVQFWRDQRNLI